MSIDVMTFPSHLYCVESAVWAARLVASSVMAAAHSVVVDRPWILELGIGMRLVGG